MSIINTVQKAFNKGFTENEAATNKSSLSKCLDLFSIGGALRQRPDHELIDLFMQAFQEDSLKALKISFYLRDIRGGQGERRFFRIILHELANSSHKEVVTQNLPHIAEYGRWDDILSLVGTPCENEAMLLIYNQLKIDREIKAPSLLAKWLPSENTSSKKTRELATKIKFHLGYSSKMYRQLLSNLRKKIKLIEHDISTNRWQFINYSGVPSKAMNKYKKAFFKHDEERFKQYLEDVATGKQKINTSTLYPHDIVRQVLNNYDPDKATRLTIEQLWNNLPNYLPDDFTNSLVVADVSGSMIGLPIEICISLAIYLAERNSGPFKDYFITFSDIPTLQKIRGKDITDKVNNLARANWNINTNIQAVYNLILKQAITDKISQDEMPGTIYLISDISRLILLLIE